MKWWFLHIVGRACFCRLRGWSEGSELSQLIVHSQLQIELLVLLA